MRPPDGKHPTPCPKCQTPTYRASGICWTCDPSVPKRNGIPGPRRSYPDVRGWPEDYLMACAEELARRHRERTASLARIGIVVEAA